MFLGLNTTLRINNTLIQKEHNGTIYIVDPTTETIHTLNETATSIWKYLRKPRSVQNIIHMVTDEFDISPTQAKQDITKFLTEYLNRKMLSTIDE